MTDGSIKPASSGSSLKSVLALSAGKFSPFTNAARTSLAVVKFVIAQSHGIVADGVHNLNAVLSAILDVEKRSR